MVATIEHLHATTMSSNDGEPLPWQALIARFELGGTYWLSTVDAEGCPHCVPVLAVAVDDIPYVVVGHATRKARSLAANPHCVLTRGDDTFDLIVEARARQRTDGETLHRVAVAYATTYGWPVVVRDGAFHDTEGAPTAGPPPYLVYALEPTVAFALGRKDDSMRQATRWRVADAPG